MKKTAAGIISLALTVAMLFGTMASAAEIESTDNQGNQTASSKESLQGESTQGENTQHTEMGAEESQPDDKGVQAITILEFSEFDMKGQTPYQTIEIPRGTPLEGIGLPEAIAAVAEGSEKSQNLSVTWECTDDGFGGKEYLPEHPNEDSVYTFTVKLGDTVTIAEALQKSMEEEGARLPWIEVRYQKEAEAVQANTKAGGLTEDPSYAASADNPEGTLRFLTTGSSAFDIKGLKSGTPVQTTYQNAGYEMFLAVGDTQADRSGKKNIAITNGKVGTINGMQVQPLLTFTEDGAYVKVKYKVYNPAQTAKAIELCGGADVMIGSDDEAAIKRNATGITMVEGGGTGSQFSMYSKSTFGVTPLDTLWFGKYDERQGNYWTDRTGGDLA